MYDTKITEFFTTCQQNTNRQDYPQASAVEKNVLIYDGNTLRLIHKSNRRSIMLELHRALFSGPGVVVVKKFYTDTEFLQRGSEIFNQIIDTERQTLGEKGDHFAKANTNARIWNVFEKMLYVDADYFINYYGNPLYSLICESWLGPGYQLTAQVNLTFPGSKAQMPHCDYHLGFQNDDVITLYPIAVQAMSQMLTLQGGIAHNDIPLAAGPTSLLPFSQQHQAGYMLMHNQQVLDYYAQHSVQISLDAGDALFFSPALFHAAGENLSTDIERMVNLLQVSSPFAKAMEKIDRVAMCKMIYPYLSDKLQTKNLYNRALDFSQNDLEQIIKSVANSYPFPTNLDLMQPKAGHNSPFSDQDIMLQSLERRNTTKVFSQLIDNNQF